MNVAKTKNIMLSIMLSFFMIFSATVPGITVQAETTVLVTRTGSKYHTHKCGNGTYYQSTLSSALARGLEPCEKCYGGGYTEIYYPTPAPAPVTNPAPAPAPKPKPISLSKSSIELVKGNTKKLSVKNASGAIKWYSNNKSVATVSNGVVKGKSAGKATITVTANGQSKTCKVKVEAPYISQSKLSLEVEDGKQLRIRGCRHTIKWKSSDKEVVSVDKDGYIFGEYPGKAVVTGKVHGKVLKCKVAVEAPLITEIEVLNPVEILPANSEYTLEITTNNDDIFKYEEIDAISSDEDVVSIYDTNKNKIELQAGDYAGTTTITIFVGGQDIDFNITVDGPAQPGTTINDKI